MKGCRHDQIRSFRYLCFVVLNSASNPNEDMAAESFIKQANEMKHARQDYYISARQAVLEQLDQFTGQRCVTLINVVGLGNIELIVIATNVVRPGFFYVVINTFSIIAVIFLSF